MNKKLKFIFIWTLSVILTLAISVYQRLTGPTTPYRVSYQTQDKKNSSKLPRTWSGKGNAEVNIQVDDITEGQLIYRRYNSYDYWDTLTMFRSGNKLTGYLPNQPPAGKIEYLVRLNNHKETFFLTASPVVIRFKGEVPAYILIPHILCMFLSLFFAIRGFFEVLFIQKKTFLYSNLTLICLILGGIIFGPIVQKYAFGVYWSGWPFGHDMTDNKTVIAVLAYAFSVIILLRKSKNRFWPIFAFAVLLAVYIIPHSIFGSELEHRIPENQTEQKSN